MARAIRDTLDSFLVTNPATLVMGEAVGAMGGVGGTCEGLLLAHGPERVVETPLSESGLLGVAAGLAMGGRIPILELPSAGRVHGALEQLLGEISTLAHRSGGEFMAPLILRLPCGPAGQLNESSVAGLLCSAEGLCVVSPSTPGDAAGLLRSAVQHRGPVVILEPMRLYGQRGRVTDAKVPIGSARRVREGTQVTLLAWGAGVALATAAAESCESQGFDAEVLDLRSLSPLDVTVIAESVRRTGRVLVVEAGSPDRCLTDRLLRAATDAAFLYLESPPALAAGGSDQIAAAVARSVQF
jgi:pyruvate dehydrogenase E1 component beta subunit